MSAPVQPYGSYPPPPVVPTARVPKNGLGTAGFVLGLLAALFSIIPIIGVIAWPMAILGLIFGIIGISRARAGVATNKGLAVAGTVLSAIALVICIAWTAAAAQVGAELDRAGDAEAASQPAAVEAGQAIDATAGTDGTVPFGHTWRAGRGVPG